MKKHSESLCAVACFVLMALFVFAFSQTIVNLFGMIHDNLDNALAALPWK